MMEQTLSKERRHFKDKLKILSLNLELSNRVMNVAWAFSPHPLNSWWIRARGFSLSDGLEVIVECAFDKVTLEITDYSQEFEDYFLAKPDKGSSFLTFYPPVLHEKLRKVLFSENGKSESVLFKSDGLGTMKIRNDEWTKHPTFGFQLKLCNLDSESMTVANLILPMGGFVPSHVHQQAQKNFVISGEYTDPETGKSYTSGDVQIIPQRQKHGLASEKGAMITITWVPPLKPAT